MSRSKLYIPEEPEAPQQVIVMTPEQIQHLDRLVRGFNGQLTPEEKRQDMKDILFTICTFITPITLLIIFGQVAKFMGW